MHVYMSTIINIELWQLQSKIQVLAVNAMDVSKDVVPRYDIFEGIKSYLYPTGGARAGVLGFISAFWPRTCDRKEQGSRKHSELLQGIRGDGSVWQNLDILIPSNSLHLGKIAP